MPVHRSGFSMALPLAMYHLAVVSFIAHSLVRGLSLIRVCTEPLPKLVVPTTIPRSQSWIAPARISEALALPPFTRTTIGKSESNRAGVRAWNVWSCPCMRPLVLTMSSPVSRKMSLTSTACVRRPPGLLRRSRIRLIMPASSSSSSLADSSSVDVRENLAMRT